MNRGIATTLLTWLVCCAASVAQPSDRLVLETLYHATDGPNWTNRDG